MEIDSPNPCIGRISTQLGADWQALIEITKSPQNVCGGRQIGLGLRHIIQGFQNVEQYEWTHPVGPLQPNQLSQNLLEQHDFLRLSEDNI